VLNPDGGTELSPIHALLDVSEDVKGPVRLYTATEEGEFSMIELLDPGTENFSKGVRSVIPAHTGPCVSLRRSPFVPKIYFSIGDWTFNLWKEGVASPLFVSPFCNCLYTCGAWSPSRPAVIFIGRADGFIDIWDLNDRSHEPSMTVSATPVAVTSMDFHTSANRQMLAVGDEQGTVHVVEVPRNLRRAANNEKQFAQNFSCARRSASSMCSGGRSNERRTRRRGRPSPLARRSQRRESSPKRRGWRPTSAKWKRPLSRRWASARSRPRPRPLTIDEMPLPRGTRGERMLHVWRGLAGVEDGRGGAARRGGAQSRRANGLSPS